MEGLVDTGLGKIAIDTDVIATYAGSVAVECFGIVGMKHGINVGITDNKITLEFHVIVAYGVSISAVSDNLISNVKYKVEEFTGLTIEKINILVEGVRVID